MEVKIVALFLIIFGAVHAAEKDYNKIWDGLSDDERALICRFGYGSDAPKDDNELKNCIRFGTPNLNHNTHNNLDDAIAGGLQHGSLDPAALAVKRFIAFLGNDDDNVNIHDLIKERSMGCGNNDIGREPQNKLINIKWRNGRAKRYALEGSAWGKRPVTWRVVRFPNINGFTNEDINNLLTRAFQYWSKYTKLTFRYTRSSADIEMLFAKYSHGDGIPFDGPQGTLAHAFFPRGGGDIHFDESESWQLRNGRRGVDFMQVAVHEIGHSIGLLHSKVRGSVMYPSYLGYKRDFDLHSDDISGAQRLYGKSTNSVPVPPPSVTTTTRRPNNTPTIDLCRDTSFDAMTQSFNGRSYIFKGKYYYRYHSDGTVNSRRLIHSDFQSLPSNTDVQALLYWEQQGRLFLFTKDQRYIKYTAQSGNTFIAASGYPKYIDPRRNSRVNGRRIGWDYVPTLPDATFVDKKTGYSIFMKNNRFHVYVPSHGTYPRGYTGFSTTYWRGLPSNGKAMAGTTWGGRSFIFYPNGNYYRLSMRTYSVDSGYPKKSAKLWFNCGDQKMAAMEDIAAENNGFVKVTKGNIENNKNAAATNIFIENTTKPDKISNEAVDSGSDSVTIFAKKWDIFVTLVMLFYVLFK